MTVLAFEHGECTIVVLDYRDGRLFFDSRSPRLAQVVDIILQYGAHTYIADILHCTRLFWVVAWEQRDMVYGDAIASAWLQLQEVVVGCSMWLDHCGGTVP